MSNGQVTTVLMVLRGGPLDAEQQIVQNLPAIGMPMTFNLPNYQSFDSEGETVVQMGLVCTYTVAEEGPPPDPTDGDTWVSSWFLDFVADAYIPLPPIGPTPTPPEETFYVWMEADAGMVVDVDSYDPSSPGVQMEADADMEVDADVIPNRVGGLNMVAVSLLFPEPILDTFVYLEGDTSMQITPS